MPLSVRFTSVYLPVRPSSTFRDAESAISLEFTSFSRNLKLPCAILAAPLMVRVMPPMFTLPLMVTLLLTVMVAPLDALATASSSVWK